MISVPAVGVSVRVGDRHAARLVVDAVGRAGRGGRDDRAIGVGDGRAQLEPAHLLHGLEELRGRAPDGDEVGVVLVDVGQLGQHAERGLEVIWVDGGHRRVYPAGIAALGAGASHRPVVHPLTLRAHEVQHLDGLGGRAREAVRPTGVEVGGLAGVQHRLLVAELEP